MFSGYIVLQSSGNVKDNLAGYILNMLTKRINNKYN